MKITTILFALALAVPCHAEIPVRLISDRATAYERALDFSAHVDGHVVQTSGTPSMEPLIHGRAYVVIVNRPFAKITKGDIALYIGRPNANSKQTERMLHRAVMHDRQGWLMSGDHNRLTESWDRMTPENYLGVAVVIFNVKENG